MNLHLYAQALLRLIGQQIDRLGLSDPLAGHLDLLIYLLLVLLTAYLAERLVRLLFTHLFRHSPQPDSDSLLGQLLRHRTFRRLTTLIPPLWIGLFLPVAFTHDGPLLHLLQRIVWISFFIALTATLTTLLSSVQEVLLTHARLHDRPVKGIVQLLQILLWFLLLVLILSILVDRSPLRLLAGLSAFAAVLLLVFRDTLLGFVSGILLAQNDMVRIGDWIEVHGQPVNGIVIDISLTIVKVRNFDNTIATLPPYQLISTPFINWRGMRESFGRLIYITLYLRTATVRSHTEGEEQPNTAHLRRHLMHYLLHHPEIVQSPAPLVYLGSPAPYGLPLQIFCYTRQRERSAYMAVRSEVLDRAALLLARYGLQPAEYPSGGNENAPYITPSSSVV